MTFPVPEVTSEEPFCGNEPRANESAFSENLALSKTFEAKARLLSFNETVETEGRIWDTHAHFDVDTE